MRYEWQEPELFDVLVNGNRTYLVDTLDNDVRMAGGTWAQMEKLKNRLNRLTVDGNELTTLLELMASIEGIREQLSRE